ncbi:MAG: hypothetical protein ACYDCC_05025 [Actinomycetota bacterium]
MAVIWGVENWVWIAIGAISLSICVVILRVLARAVQGIRELTDSVTLSGKLLQDSISSARQEVERAQARLSKLGSSESEESESSAWGDW